LKIIDLTAESKRRKGMAYDETLAARIRDVLGGRDEFSEKKMFGGIAFMLQGNMLCGVTQDRLMVRVGAENHDAALDKPGARPMDFNGRPMRGIVFVDPPGYSTDAQLNDWLTTAVDFGETLPPKKPAAKRKAKQ
jgi:TfoX/Sxy family transcriptional regulator of competence genes